MKDHRIVRNKKDRRVTKADAIHQLQVVQVYAPITLISEFTQHQSHQ